MNAEMMMMAFVVIVYLWECFRMLKEKKEEYINIQRISKHLLNNIYSAFSL